MPLSLKVGGVNLKGVYMSLREYLGWLVLAGGAFSVGLYWLYVLLDDPTSRNSRAVESALGEGLRFEMCVRGSGALPFRLCVMGQVFAFPDLVRLGMWLDHMDTFCDWSLSESERARHSPEALGYGVNVMHPSCAR